MELHPQTSGELKPMNCLLLRFKKLCEERDGENTPITSFEIASLGSLTTTTTRPRPSPVKLFPIIFDPKFPECDTRLLVFTRTGIVKKVRRFRRFRFQKKNC
jgi:hypothetical protein